MILIQQQIARLAGYLDGKGKGGEHHAKYNTLDL
jgi:hypothetical protein